eukprot:Protomagalhaensia_sp_Gyna_25__712@NODE_1335_length_1935_cov_425_004747_g1067_i0_p2_GENE_NODE_1335_length_1935_cov_425_004747_g1067_i0NODE_1335_length_1935_cov_425_004747_g1067_i0_p2_ORF_typecomplete_len302_score75_44_NODE_1335_length_1935_cov_425_004747_g1067_i049906
MDTFAYTIAAGKTFQWEGEGIILTLKCIASESSGKLMVRPGGLDDFHTIAVFNDHTPSTLAMDLPFFEKADFKAEDCSVYIAGIVERADDEDSDYSDIDMGENPVPLLDSDMTDDSAVESDEEPQQVRIEEVQGSDNETPAAKAMPAKPTEKEAESSEGEESTADSDEEEPAKETEQPAALKTNQASAPIKAKIDTKKDEQKPTAVKKQAPKDETKRKAQQGKGQQGKGQQQAKAQPGKPQQGKPQPGKPQQGKPQQGKPAHQQGNKGKNMNKGKPQQKKNMQRQ